MAKRAKLVKTLWDTVSSIELAIKAVQKDTTADLALIDISTAKGLLDEADKLLAKALKTKTVQRVQGKRMKHDTKKYKS